MDFFDYYLQLFLFMQSLMMNGLDILMYSISYLTRMNYAEHMFNSLLWYAKTVENIKRTYNNIYNNYPAVRYTIDYCHYSIRFIGSTLINQRIEPFEKTWICSTVLQLRNFEIYSKNKYTLIETYDYVDNLFVCDRVKNESLDEFMLVNVADTLSSIKTVALNNNNIVESMVTMKYNDQMFYRIPYRNDHQLNYNLLKLSNPNEPVSYPEGYEPIVFPAEKCPVKFLSIEYTHPSMIRSIILEIDDGAYIKNNMILSPLFVLRLLDHQQQSYIFDMKYVLKIMDDNINAFTVTSDQYVLLEKSSYKVLTWIKNVIDIDDTREVVE